MLWDFHEPCESSGGRYVHVGIARCRQADIKQDGKAFLWRIRSRLAILVWRGRRCWRRLVHVAVQKFAHNWPTRAGRDARPGWHNRASAFNSLTNGHRGTLLDAKRDLTPDMHTLFFDPASWRSSDMFALFFLQQATARPSGRPRYNGSSAKDLDHPACGLPLESRSPARTPDRAVDPVNSAGEIDSIDGLSGRLSPAGQLHSEKVASGHSMSYSPVIGADGKFIGALVLMTRFTASIIRSGSPDQHATCRDGILSFVALGLLSF